MLYSHHNSAPGASIVEVETGKPLKRVMRVDTAFGVVWRLHNPCRLDHKGEILLEPVRFRAVHAIHGQDARPSLFHCYGRKAESAVQEVGA